MTNTSKIQTVVLSILLAAVATGCATKKHVRAQIEPLEKRIGTLEQTSRQQGESIEELENGVSRADERARSALDKAREASEAAAKADENAVRAGKAATDASRDAQGARQLAQDGLEQSKRNGRRLDAVDLWKIAEERKVYFRPGSSALSAAARKELDDAVAAISAQPRYILELEGYTDRTGPASLNTELSHKRANAVLRYLVAEHKIPLHRIHVAGLGSESPAADNRTRDGRQMNRRVEVRLWVPKPPEPTERLEAKLEETR